MILFPPFFLSSHDNKVDMKENKLKNEAVSEGRSRVPPSRLPLLVESFYLWNQISKKSNLSKVSKDERILKKKKKKSIFR